MPLPQDKAEVILSHMRSMDVAKRLEGINAAREMNKLAFKDEMTDAEFAFAAYILESQYNLVREELRVKQIRVKADSDSSGSAKPAKVPSGPKAKKEKPKVDMGSMAASFAAFLQQQKKPEGS